MVAIVDADFRAVRVADEFELIDSPGVAARIRGDLAGAPDARLILTPPIYYSLANGVADNRAINDAMVAAAKARPGARACGVVEPKYGDVAAAELERMASIGLAGVVWSAAGAGLFRQRPYPRRTVPPRAQAGPGLDDPFRALFDQRGSVAALGARCAVPRGAAAGHRRVRELGEHPARPREQGRAGGSCSTRSRSSARAGTSMGWPAAWARSGCCSAAAAAICSNARWGSSSAAGWRRRRRRRSSSRNAGALFA